jgi:hypothetical protein
MEISSWNLRWKISVQLSLLGTVFVPSGACAPVFERTAIRAWNFAAIRGKPNRRDTEAS